MNRDKIPQEARKNERNDVSKILWKFDANIVFPLDEFVERRERTRLERRDRVKSRERRVKGTGRTVETG